MMHRITLSLFGVVASTLAGCGTIGHEPRRDNGSLLVAPYGAIPRSAESVASGVGGFEWHAPRDGRIWVGDDQMKRLVLSEVVREGDVVAVDVPSERVKLNGRTISEQNLKREHRHSVFFR